VARSAETTSGSLKRRNPGLQARVSGNEFSYQEENVMTNISVNRAKHNIQPAPEPLSISLELGKEYCVKLIKVLLRHSQPSEIERLTRLVETQAETQLANRYNPGLNDAKYDLYRRFWLKGGAV
jgi:hypothetical protein